jgi:alkyl sulfatase BDS1-like metallo-beta-lactamase superfamily hydrolase
MPHDSVYPFDDERDFADAERGFIAALEPGVVCDAAGAVVWDNDSYAFLAGQPPDTVDPSLWRQSVLNANLVYEVRP